ncbi:MAG: cyanophycin synthetase, partial [Methylococcales bacterium]|nr:cyanophycin synthetase [Methylococcales bacterium]
QNTLLLRLGETFFYTKHDKTWSWQGLAQTISDLPPPALKGNHQYRNASAAILATQCLANRLPVSETSLKMGLKNVKLAGRFQLIEGKNPVLLDVGHNPQAVQTLVDYLHENFPDRRIHAIFSMMKDKDIVSVLTLMKPVVSDWFFAPLPQNLRAVTEPAIREMFELCQISAVHLGFSGFAHAFAAAKNHTQVGDLILVFGSFFLVSDCCVNLKIGEIKNGS